MSKARLAVVDDDEAFADYLQVWLRSRGYAVSYTHLTLPTNREV